MRKCRSLLSGAFAVQAMALCFLSGCGGESLGKVHGKVSFADGTPVTSGLVMFLPEDPDNKLGPRGDITADGSFEVATHKPGDGAPLGKYKVAVYPPSGSTGPAVFDSHYSDFATSGLEIEVKAGKNEFPITVTKPGKGPKSSVLN